MNSIESLGYLRESEGIPRDIQKTPSLSTNTRKPKPIQEFILYTSRVYCMSPLLTAYTVPAPLVLAPH